MTDTITDWMNAYIRAWDSNDPDDIRALFTEDAEYLYAPYDTAVKGQDAIVDSWLEGRDEPGSYTFTWKPVAVTPTTAVIQGVTDYHDEKTYDNLWVIELAPDGRASRFTEWYMTADKGES